MRIHFASQVDGNTRQPLDNLSQGHRADHHHVEVAVRSLGAAGHRTKDKGHGNAFVAKRLPQHVGQSTGLQHQAVNLWVQRMIRVSAIISPVAALTSFDKSECHEILQFLPHRGQREARLPFEFADMQFPRTDPQQQPKQFRFDARRQ